MLIFFLTLFFSLFSLIFFSADNGVDAALPPRPRRNPSLSTNAAFATFDEGDIQEQRIATTFFSYLFYLQVVFLFLGQLKTHLQSLHENKCYFRLKIHQT